MDILLIISAVVCAVIGIVGSIVPALPGPPVSFVAYLLLYFCTGCDISFQSLAVYGVLAAIVTVVDFVAPVWLTKKSGGSKAATRGATIGLVLALFTGMWGVLVLPFLGALLGELSTGSASAKAVKVASYSFLAFILTTGVKMVYSFVMIAKVVSSAWHVLMN